MKSYGTADERRGVPSETFMNMMLSFFEAKLYFCV